MRFSTFLAAVLIAAPAFAQTPESKVMRFVADWQREAGMSATPEFRLVELNGAAPPEAFLILRGQGVCGAAACPAFILDLSGPQARSVADLLGNRLEALPASSQGWRDVTLDGRRFSFRSGNYKASR